MALQKPAGQPGPDDHVLTLCHMLSNRIGKAFVAEMEAHEITVAEWRVLLTLALNATASGKEITERWAMDKMAVNRAISSLQKRNLIEKNQSSEDRRVINLMLTTSGQNMYDTLVPIANQRYHKLMAGLDKPEEQHLRATLLKMILHADSLAD
jgi:DNA-binding MarR family transcriptional regulator